MADEEREVLSRLEARLGRASDVAERLIAEAARGATHRPPPAGWQMPAAGEEPSGRRAGDAETLVQAIQAIRELLPEELVRRLAEAVRELLLALRALIDWYLERLERRRAAAKPEVQDIPIL